MLAAGALACAGVANPAAAQDRPAAEPAADQASREVAFEANSAAYDQDSDTVTAEGDVILRSGDQSVRADAVSWNRTTGQIVATGNIRLVDENGNQLFTDRLELTDALKAGAMENMLLVFREGGRLAAAQGTRADDGDIDLTQASFTGCAVTNAEGCDIQPSWRINARRVRYDEQTHKVRFEGASFELFGVRLLPLPGLVLRADNEAQSGVMVPEIALTASNGVELKGSYYYRLDPSRDLLATGYLYSAEAPMISARYRELTPEGAWQAEAYGTYSARIPLGGVDPVSERDIRGYLAANGRFQLDPHWSVTGSLRVASDRTFLRRYDISRDDRLRSTVNVERIDDDSYLSISGWATQLLLVRQPQGLQPVALPLVDYRRRLTEPVLGGKIELQANTLALTRASGQDTQRAFARAQWSRREVTALGQEITFTALLRGDVYHSDDNLTTVTPLYRGQSGWQARAVAIGAVDIKWPFVGPFLGGTQLFTPRLQVVATPPVRNLEVPNEDARSIDLEDSNLFALNRFPGYDRIEDGTRVTYGFDWQVDLPGWRVKSTLGQSYRLTDKPALFPQGTGLTQEFSDIVGRTEVRYHDLVKVTHRFRLDKDNLAVRRNEVDATVGNDRHYVEVGYLRLNRDADVTFEDLNDREELRVAGRTEFMRHWSVFGSAVVNLTDRDEDPSFTSDGFKPLRTRLGLAYEDDCLEIGLVWRRDYVAVADADKGSFFRVYFNLKNLGVSR